ncbi:ketosteroid isomerase-like protein [Acidovorax soli]|uniref:Ketosteroid isomerase-like protein n=1 Tax=Acidovorax soli TaxID=592050 RepID=A0A7X0PHV3_9BURK|nr:tetratricopeptide repeat protein [Acidovorax soli]MBB6561832.1 ketosteroid isomerase-like protein [Acidovorax soli]
MKQPVSRTLPRLLRLVALTALIGSGLAHAADDYADITQLLKAGKAGDALAKADQRLAANPRDPQLRFLRGVAQSDSGKPAEAIATFTKLTEEYPELPEPYNNLAVLYANQNQLDKARTALEMAIRTNPSYATAHENLGDIYAKLASQAYNKALQLDATNANSVKPKLALIRELFSADPAGKRPAAAAPAPAPAVVATQRPAPAPAPAATPAAPAPAPAAAPTPAPAPAAAAPAPAAAATPAAPAAAAAATQDVTAAVQAWAAAWAAKDMKAYLAAYDKDFDPPGRQTRAAWEKEREARIVGKSKIAVQVSDITVSVSGNKATARFRQAYSADALNVTSRKTLDLVQNGGRWAIVRESTGG